MKTLASFAIVVIAFGVIADADAACLQNNKAASVVGQLHQETFSGVTDRPLTYWLLHLNAPICTVPDPTDRTGEAENFGARNVTEIQLLLWPDQYDKYRQFLGRKVRVTGKAFHQGNAMHVMEVLMDSVEIHATEDSH